MRSRRREQSPNDQVFSTGVYLRLCRFTERLARFLAMAVKKRRGVSQQRKSRFSEEQARSPLTSEENLNMKPRFSRKLAIGDRPTVIEPVLHEALRALGYVE